jgi:hypothetical protein
LPVGRGGTHACCSSPGLRYRTRKLIDQLSNVTARRRGFLPDSSGAGCGTSGPSRRSTRVVDGAGAGLAVLLSLDDRGHGVRSASPASSLDAGSSETAYLHSPEPASVADDPRNVPGRLRRLTTGQRQRNSSRGRATAKCVRRSTTRQPERNPSVVCLCWSSDGVREPGRRPLSERDRALAWPEAVCLIPGTSAGSSRSLSDEPAARIRPQSLAREPGSRSQSTGVLGGPVTVQAAGAAFPRLVPVTSAPHDCSPWAAPHWPDAGSGVPSSTRRYGRRWVVTLGGGERAWRGVRYPVPPTGRARARAPRPP